MKVKRKTFKERETPTTEINRAQTKPLRITFIMSHNEFIYFIFIFQRFIYVYIPL